MGLKEQPSQEQYRGEQMKPGNEIYARPRDPFSMQFIT
jgi:hypothetical protein